MKGSWRPGRQSLLLDCWCSLRAVHVAIQKGACTNVFKPTALRKGKIHGGLSQLCLMVDPIGS